MEIDHRSLEARVIRLKDIHDIQKLQSRYGQYLTFGKSEKIIKLWATNKQDISFECGDSGVYVGLDSIKRVFTVLGERAREIGRYDEWHSTTPVIEVARDGKTAKGVWFSNGGILTSGKEKMQCWVFGKYSCDYIKEEGQWKFWHMHWFQTFQCQIEKGWLNEQEVSIGTMRVPPFYPPDKPTTYHQPYSSFKVNRMVPEPPEPY